MKLVKQKEFKEQFWAWFDALPLDEKNKFLYYPSDTAEVFFYNKFYKHASVTRSATNGD